MTRRNNEPIRNFEDGDSVSGFAYLAKMERRQDKNGRDFLDLVLKDASGSITGKVWSDSPALNGDFQLHDFVAFRGTVQSYRDQLQLNVRECRQAVESDREHGFDEYFGILYSNDMRPVELVEGKTPVEYPVVQCTLTKRYTERALAFIEKNRDRPFFLWLAAIDAHRGWDGDEEWDDGAYGPKHDLDAVIVRGLAREPDDRWPSAHQLRDALLEVDGTIFKFMVYNLSSEPMVVLRDEVIADIAEWVARVAP